MKYFVIYSIDCQGLDSIGQYQPPKYRTWDCTEGDDQYEYDDLEGEWEKGKHRKYVKELTSDDFRQFVDHCCLYAEDVETMGSLTGMGLLPAICFNCDFETAILNAYVTPLPMNMGRTQEEAELIWDTVRKMIISKYGV